MNIGERNTFVGFSKTAFLPSHMKSRILNKNMYFYGGLLKQKYCSICFSKPTTNIFNVVSYIHNLASDS